MSKAVRDPLLPITHYQRLTKQPEKSSSKKAVITTVLLVLVLIGAGAFFLHQEIEALNKEAAEAKKNAAIMETKSAAPTEEPVQQKAGLDEACGGIAALQCDDELTCQLDGTYPDAGGTCVNKPEPTKSTVIPTMPIQTSQPPAAPSEPVAICTQDAMQCPDGSWVGRSGPACEFKCPTP